MKPLYSAKEFAEYARAARSAETLAGKAGWYAVIAFTIIENMDKIWDAIEDGASNLARSWLTLRRTWNPVLAATTLFGLYDWTMHDPRVGDVMKRWLAKGQSRPIVNAYIEAMQDWNMEHKTETDRFWPETVISVMSENVLEGTDMDVRQRWMVIETIFRWAYMRLLGDDARWAATLVSAGSGTDKSQIEAMTRDLVYDLNEFFDDAGLANLQLVEEAYQIKMDPDLLEEAAIALESGGVGVGVSPGNPWGIDAPMLPTPSPIAVKAEYDRFEYDLCDEYDVEFDLFKKLKKKLSKPLTKLLQTKGAALLGKAAKFIPALGIAAPLVSGLISKVGGAIAAKKAPAIVEKIAKKVEELGPPPEEEEPKQLPAPAVRQRQTVEEPQEQAPYEEGEYEEAEPEE